MYVTAGYTEMNVIWCATKPSAMSQCSDGVLCVIFCYTNPEVIFSQLTGSGEHSSGTMGWRSPGCFFWVLSKRSIAKPDPHGEDIQRESLGTDMS